MSDLEDEPALLFAFDVRGRVAEKISWDAIRAQAAPSKEGAYRWIGLNGNQGDAREWLSNESGASALAVSALLAEETRPRVFHMGRGMVVILRGVNLNPGAEPEDMISVRLWVESGRVISVQLRRLKAIFDVRLLLEKPESTPESAGELFATIASRLAARMEPVINNYGDMTDDVEAQSIEGPHREIRARLVDLRRDAIILRRYIAPQRDILNSLSMDQTSLFDDRARLDLRETADRVTRLVEELDSVRDRASVVNDQIVDQRAEEMNRNMLMLSVVASIFLPLSFVTGLLGVNLGGIPGAQDPHAFGVLLLVMVFIGGGLIFYFKRKEWL